MLKTTLIFKNYFNIWQTWVELLLICWYMNWTQMVGPWEGFRCGFCCRSGTQYTYNVLFALSGNSVTFTFTVFAEWKNRTNITSNRSIEALFLDVDDCSVRWLQMWTKQAIKSDCIASTAQTFLCDLNWSVNAFEFSDLLYEGCSAAVGISKFEPIASEIRGYSST